MKVLAAVKSESYEYYINLLGTKLLTWKIAYKNRISIQNKT